MATVGVDGELKGQGPFFNVVTSWVILIVLVGVFCAAGSWVGI